MSIRPGTALHEQKGRTDFNTSSSGQLCVQPLMRYTDGDEIAPTPGTLIVRGCAVKKLCPRNVTRPDSNSSAQDSPHT